jgi:hypothetical protein
MMDGKIFDMWLGGGGGGGGSGYFTSHVVIGCNI